MDTEKSKLRELFTRGQKVHLDIDRANTSIVKVVSQTPQRLYTKVTDDDDTWDVMTYRLTEIINFK